MARKPKTVEPEFTGPPSIETKPKRRPKRGGRAPGAEQTDEAKTQRYMAANAVGEENSSHKAAVQRAARLKQLIEPHTEAMVQVMIDIASNADHVADPKNKPSIHASIRLEAASRVLDRAYGKPKEHLTVDDDRDAPGTEQDETTKLLNGILSKLGAPLLDVAGQKPTSDGEQSSVAGT